MALKLVCEDLGQMLGAVAWQQNQSGEPQRQTPFAA
jgi:hypothetical protein